MTSLTDAQRYLLGMWYGRMVTDDFMDLRDRLVLEHERLDRILRDRYGGELDKALEHARRGLQWYIEHPHETRFWGDSNFK